MSATTTTVGRRHAASGGSRRHLVGRRAAYLAGRDRRCVRRLGRWSARHPGCPPADGSTRTRRSSPRRARRSPSGASSTRGLLAYALWQLLPGQRRRTRHRRIGYAVAASLVLNALWIGVVQFDLLGASVAVIVVLVAVLAWLFVQIRRMLPRNALDALITDGSIGLYLGWVVVATAANVTAVLAASGFEGWGIAPSSGRWSWSRSAPGVGVAIGIAGRGRIAPMLSLCWGLAGVGFARLTDEPASRITGFAALVGVGVVVIVTLGARIGAIVADRSDRMDRSWAEREREREAGSTAGPPTCTMEA